VTYDGEFLGDVGHANIHGRRGKTQDDIEKGLTAAKKAGLSVFRTWGFNDKNATYDPAGLPQYGSEGAGTTEVVFQRWDNGKATIDLSGFDKVVKAASKTGIKLLVALTNNWADYGGMDVYTVNLGGKYHDDVSLPLFPLFRIVPCR
jgi:mannan endo-1,4-beta-mannosidase